MLPQPERMETSRAGEQAEGLALRGCEELTVKMEGGDKWISSHIDLSHLSTLMPWQEFRSMQWWVTRGKRTQSINVTKILVRKHETTLTK